LEKVGLEEIKNGRKFHPEFEPYNEEKYLEMFSDIKEAVEKGLFNSGFEHFCLHGYNEIINGLRNWPKTIEIKVSDKEEIELIEGFDEEDYLKIKELSEIINNYYYFFSEDFCEYNLGINLKSKNFINKYIDFYKKNNSYPRLSIFFDPIYYLNNNKDLLKENIDLYVHFLTQGIFELRNPHPLIDLQYIVKYNKFSISNISDLINYIKDNKQTSPYFDPDYYLNSYPDIKNAGIPAIEHYILSGGFEKRFPNAFFNYELYAKERKLENFNGLDIIVDFIVYGDYNKVKFSDKFDYSYYEKQLIDKNIDKYNLPLYYHFVVFSKKFGLQPKEKFNILKENIYASENIYKFLKNTNNKIETSKINLKLFNVEKFDEIFENVVQKFSFENSNSPEISIVIPVYNAFKELIECLLSIQKYIKNKNIEIIIADDCSTDERIEKVFKNNKNFIYIRNNKNLGFLKNVNNAIKKARGKYILLLNSDVQLLDDIIEKFKNELENDPQVGLVGPKILFPNGTLQEAGCIIRKNCSTEMIGINDDPNKPQYNISRYVDYISGACWFFEKLLFEDLGGFDEDFAPAYAEDLDFCARVIKEGKKILYSPKSCIVHHLSVSSNSYSSFFKYYQSAINKEKFIKKHGQFFKNFSKVKPIAFYLPQYHEFEQNNYWWGKGYTEWRAAANAKPQFKNHYQPHIPADLGFYDLTNPKSFEQQAILAKRFGLYGFCFYYYNFGEFELMEKALETFIESKADINFCLCWANENWTRRWDGLDENILLKQEATDDDAIFLKVLKDMSRFIKDKRYIKIDDRPLILIYRPLLFTNIKHKIRLWRKYWKDTYGEDLYLCVVDSMERAKGNSVAPHEIGFDAAVEFPSHYVETRAGLEKEEELPDKKFEGILIDYIEAVKEICNRNYPNYKRFPGVFPSWDNTPRRDNRGAIFKNAHPSAFQYFMEEKVKEAMLFSGDERMIFINAWNEWGEGAHLEPDLKFGNSWLQVVEKIVKEN
jgi:GT2 family glycosyltransferase